MTADETPAELRARLTNEERAEGRRDLTFPWNGPWRSWLLKHGEALLDAADDVTRLEAERDALLARLTAAEAERDEALIAINGGCGCPAPFDTCPHDEPLLPALNDARARIAELTAPLEPNDSLLERAKEVVKVGGLYGLSDGTVDLIAELAARCEQLTALREAVSAYSAAYGGSSDHTLRWARTHLFTVLDAQTPPLHPL